MLNKGDVVEGMIGFRSERLLVVEYSHKASDGHMWKCLCDCGKAHIAREYDLTRSRIRSCGCLRKEPRERSRTHGMSQDPIYKRWASMKERCDNKNSTGYDNYGGRGITYDVRWRDFLNFYNDMSENFEEGLELDRIDVNGNYCKENCRWVSHNENNYNKTRQSNNLSGKTGVSWSKRDSRWVSYIDFEGRRISLGTFLTKDVAIQVRKEAELKYYGYNRD